MKTIVFMACFLVMIAAPARSEEAGGSPESATTAVVDSTAPVVSLTWDYTPEELYVNGGKPFKYKGRSFVLKLGFRRGAYERFVNNYKTVPSFILSDITDGAGNYTVWNVGLLEWGGRFRATGADLSLMVSLKGNRVTVSRASKNKKPGKTIAEFSLDEFRAAWAENAARYKVDFNNKQVYLVPQVFRYPAGCNSAGYVVGSPEPYFADTGLPLDFVELFRYTKASTDRRRRAYSIPLTLTFSRSEDNVNKWILSEMASSSLEAALDEEADSPEDCNRELLEKMKKLERMDDPPGTVREK